MAYTTINKPADYFNTKLYSGDSNTTQAITGVGFQPDWVWIKARTEVHQHNLFDVIRGVTKNLVTNSTNAEATTDQYGYLASFDSDGFTTQKGSSADQWNVNKSGENYVAWNWLAGGSASSNTDGSITSSVSANTTAGFSIVSYEGTGSAATVGHGLGAIPKMIIVKDRSTASTNWVVHHKDVTAGNLYLNSTSAVGSGKDVGENATSSVFDITTWDNVNGSGDNYIAYCFAEKKGFSKFGSYTGNGNADGTFVYTGFKPAMILLKRTDSTASWFLYDNKRDSFNEANASGLYPNLSNAEFSGTSNVWDFTSNGFKGRASTSDTNASGGSYIYMAFAENPLVTSGGTPATAR